MHAIDQVNAGANLFTTKQELNMSFNRESFRQELRQLIDRHIGASSGFKDYVEI